MGPWTSTSWSANSARTCPRALVATDFDGTLAPLTPDPQDSRPVAGAVEALTALTRPAPASR